MIDRQTAEIIQDKAFGGQTTPSIAREMRIPLTNIIDIVYGTGVISMSADTRDRLAEHSIKRTEAKI